MKLKISFPSTAMLYYNEFFFIEKLFYCCTAQITLVFILNYIHKVYVFSSLLLVYQKTYAHYLNALTLKLTQW